VSDELGAAMDIPEIEELIGAYALDALEPDERQVVDQHLPTCPRCRAELADHLEVAAMLGNTGAPAPDGLWARISASLEESPPALRLAVTPLASDVGGPASPTSSTARAGAPAPVVDLPARRGGLNRWLAGAVAAAVLVIGALGVQVVRENQRMDDMAASQRSSGLQGDMIRAMADPASHKMTLSSPSGAGMSAAAVMTETGTGYFVATSLPALGDDQTYQLWGIMADGQVVSLGVLGHDPHMAAFAASGGGLTGLVVTQEVNGGVTSSGKPALLTT
jgi:anti-sigma-K factor RskA